MFSQDCLLQQLPLFGSLVCDKKSRWSLKQHSGIDRKLSVSEHFAFPIICQIVGIGNFIFRENWL